MRRGLTIARLAIWRLAIPLRRRVDHAAAERIVAEPVVVEVELADGTTGYGETHPRPYVTGEDIEGTVATIRELFLPRLVEMRPGGFGEVLETVTDLPLTAASGRVVAAARAAVELALLDAYSRAFKRSLEEIAGWLGEPGLGPPGSSQTAHFGGVVTSIPPSKVSWSIRKMRLLRLPHFKIKVGDEEDESRVRAAVRTLQRGLDTGRLTLRLDANGAWDLEQAADRLQEWQDWPILNIEQPLPKTESPASWGELSCRTTLPLMADESLVTPADAEALIACQGAAWFNIRISKNGGLIPAIRLASMARRNQIDCQLGCMVGETGILSAAARWFLQLVPGIQIAEGNFGSFLLRDDVLRKPIRFGFGGHWRPLRGPGLGVDVDAVKLEAYAVCPPLRITL